MNRWATLFLKLSLALLVAVGLGLVYLNAHLSKQFESLSWAVGAKIYARPLELFAGANFSLEQVRFELDLLNYQRVTRNPGRGEYEVNEQTLRVGMRGHDYPDGIELEQRIQIEFESNQVRSLTHQNNQSVDIVRFEPLVLAQLSGAHADREVIQLSDLPRGFIDMLIAVEDRAFYEHAGLSVTGILRALVNNVLAGRFAQGGSTLTQQLVKNLYLTRERTLSRKALEAIYAVLLDAGFSKEQILEAYVNEVFLGQWGNRAIHGFGTAAQFYFGRPMNELTTAQQALLIGLIKGPSALNPRRYPERALRRRNLVLSLAASEGVISQQQAETFSKVSLAVPKRPADRIGRFPGYVSIVHRELKNDYTNQQLNAAGLKIYTALDPQVHRGLVKGRQTMLKKLKDSGLDPKNDVQMGAIVADIPTGEIQAVLAGRDHQIGFHRVLDAKRQIGSLVKPFVVAAAIEEDPRLHSGTLVRDEAVSIRDAKGDVWAPKNYDKTEKGVVRLETVIANSINQATVHLALGLGFDVILERLSDYGIPVGPSKPPATVLGVSEMSPYQIATRFQGLLNQGYLTPLKAVRSVVDDNGRPLTRRAFQSTQLMSAQAAAQVDHMMRVGATVGTGKAFGQRYPEIMASKTGTTDDGRDAWFVGADGRRLGVTWVGFDDNRKAGLVGSVAALPVISDAFRYIQRSNRSTKLPEGLEFRHLNQSGQIVDASCHGAERRPIPVDYVQLTPVSCDATDRRTDDGTWLEKWFGG